MLEEKWFGYKLFLSNIIRGFEVRGARAEEFVPHRPGAEGIRKVSLVIHGNSYLVIVAVCRCRIYLWHCSFGSFLILGVCFSNMLKPSQVEVTSELLDSYPIMCIIQICLFSRPGTQNDAQQVTRQCMKILLEVFPINRPIWQFKSNAARSDKRSSHRAPFWSWKFDA